MMESLAIAPPQIIEGEVVAEDVKRHGKNIAKARNRQVLGDIGNLVSVRQNDPKNQPPLINRPRTRNFNAKLLENGVNAAPVEEKILKAEKQVVKRITVPKKRGESKKEVEIIDISSDSDSDEEQSVLVTKVIAGTKKKTTTYTSVLTARSKAACGLDKKSKKDIVDIDAADASNDLAAVEYVEDIYSFYKSVESEWRPRDYMRSQPEINEKMRTILVEWLIDVNVRFELNPETFYLAINILDRFLSVKTVSRKELQLVGLSALLMSSKYEEIWPPQVEDLVDIADNAYDGKQILVMEKTILSALGWYLTVPTHYVFLARFIKASIADLQMENMVHYLVELGVMHYDTTIMFNPSMVAASAIYAARSALHQIPIWTNTLEHHTGYSETQLMDCAKLLAYQQWRQQQQEGSGNNKGGSLRRKYSTDERCKVAMIPPAKSLLTGTESA